MYFALNQRLMQDVEVKKAKTLEQQLAVLERFRERYAGRNRLGDLAQVLDM